MILLAGCFSDIIRKDELHTYLNNNTDSTQVVKAEVKYIIDKQGKIELRKHLIIKVGMNPYGALDLLQVVDGSTEKLASYSLRVLFADGKVRKFNAGDLIRESLSSSSEINQQELLTPSLRLNEASGSVIDLEVSYQLYLSELGFIYSPWEFGENARNLDLFIQYPADTTVAYELVNDKQKPEISQKGGITTVHYNWVGLHPKKEKHDPMEQRGSGAAVYVSAHFPFQVPDSTTNNLSPWIDYGNWYLSLIQNRLRPERSIDSLAKRITEGSTSDLEKMELIYDYCRKNIRYEQVYEEFGGFIPNLAGDIYTHKYGDCKDYSMLMHMLARRVGVKSNLVLCYRGRGRAFYPNIPVNQFNHMILLFQNEGKDYWLDGTNRIGSFGVFTDDLSNQMVLVISQNASYISKMINKTQNLLEITCELDPDGTSLSGDVTVNFRGQYALDINYLDWYLNRVDMEESLQNFCHNLISQDYTIETLAWAGQRDQFKVEMRGYFPNTLVHFKKNSYFSPALLFRALYEDFSQTTAANHLFYNPGYDQVMLDVSLPSLSVSGSVDNEAFHWSNRYNLPLGPYQESWQQNQIRDQLDSLATELSVRYKLKEL
ncbi:MAG: transglutaminase domain-containing protein [Candidatus Marinimicrobia bacterium]|nr:transglutaminase domain-containing protein [Candidatus Neomarinimicrobiota bacterium]